MRIVYMGTPEFAVYPLKKLIANKYEVVAVVTSPDRPAGRGLKLKQSEVKLFAEQYDIPILQPYKLRDIDFIDRLETFDADLFIVVAFRMLPEVVWRMPKLGTFNLHASLLPLYRGAAPINWAIINGDKQTGVTTFFIDDKIDCGNIISQEKVFIMDSDTAGTLHDKLMIVGAELVLDTVKSIDTRVVTTLPQKNDISESLRLLAPKIFKDDCFIDWSLSTIDSYNKIRGLSPYPAAWCQLADDTTVKLLEVGYIIESHSVRIGTMKTSVHKQQKVIMVSCTDGWIYIYRLQVAGKKAMNTDEYLRGNSLP